MDDALISIIIPAFNRRRWIKDCLDATRAQTYRNLEVIVVDDCSTDGTVEWLRSDPRYAFVTIHVQHRNMGASQARNMGVSLSHGELIGFIDSDDLLAPAHIETAASVFSQYPRLGLFCCDSRIIGPDGELLYGGSTWQEINGRIRHYPVRSGVRSLRDIFLFSNSFPGFVLRKSVFASVGGFDQSIFPLDDYDLALRVAGAGFQVYYCHQPLAQYRNHEGNCSGASNAIRVGTEKLRCLRLAVERNRELRELGSERRRRFSEVNFELGISQALAGKSAAAACTMLRTLARDPARALDLAGHLARRTLRNLKASRK